MVFQKSMMTSKRQDWRTPKHIYEELHKEFDFDYDPCLTTTDTIHPIDTLGSVWHGNSIFYIRY